MQIATKGGAVGEPQSNLAWPISLFGTAAENGAKSGESMPNIRATAPKCQESLLFARIFASETRLEAGRRFYHAPCFSAKIESDLFLSGFSHRYFVGSRGFRKDGGRGNSFLTPPNHVISQPKA